MPDYTPTNLPTMCGYTRIDDHMAGLLEWADAETGDVDSCGYYAWRLDMRRCVVIVTVDDQGFYSFAYIEDRQKADTIWSGLQDAYLDQTYDH